MKKHLLFIALGLTALTAPAQTAGSASSSKYLSVVDEYCPAPGQFVNRLPAYADGDDAAAMSRKCTEAIAGGNKGMITLGAYGGYVTFHFDHSIANVHGQRDFFIAGNAFAGSSEPGIVMVSKDVNHNGLPDDPWYELAGSADRDSLSKMVMGYTITYGLDSLGKGYWADSRGDSGVVPASVFPKWVKAPLAFHGTLLPGNAWDKSGKGTYWVLNSYDYGYVDNKANTDTTACSMDLDWAVDPVTRDSVLLDYVDFVRVYTGLNQKAGWLGETSTEVCGAEDRHLQASVETMRQHVDSVVDFEDIALDKDSLMPLNEGSSAFASKGFTFHYSYTPVWSYWTGFRVSGKHSTVFVDYHDQYNSCTGHGYAQSNNFAVVFPEDNNITVEGEARQVSGFYVAANTYLQNAILKGDGMTPGAFTKGDWMRMDIIATDGTVTKDTVTCYLADYRSDNEADHYYVKDWTWVDLSQLGKVSALAFRLSSSRANNYGMTTPAYFLMDDFNGAYDGRSRSLATTLHPAVATGIAAPQRALDNQPVYNLAGQRVGKDYKGVVIKNGKKYVQ